MARSVRGRFLPWGRHLTAGFLVAGGPGFSYHGNLGTLMRARPVQTTQEWSPVISGVRANRLLRDQLFSPPPHPTARQALPATAPLPSIPPTPCNALTHIPLLGPRPVLLVWG